MLIARVLANRISRTASPIPRPSPRLKLSTRFQRGVTLRYFMDQSSAPVPVVEAAASTFVPAEDVTNAMDVVPGEEPKKIRLTKAEKRALAESKRKEAWKSKRAAEKEQKKRKRDELKEKIKEEGGDPRAVLPRGKDNPLYKLKRRKLTEEDLSNQKVVLDVSFDDDMNEKEVRSLVSQITYLYGKNRVVEHPLRIYMTSFGGKLKNNLESLNGFPHWKGITSDPRPYLDMFPKESLVYLSAESEESLTDLNEDDVYIIGGLVDHNRLKGICFDKAVSQGIRTARLPIGEFMELKNRKVLTVNQVYEILLAFSVEKDWAKAFDSIIPKRKGGVLITGSESKEGEESIEGAEDAANIESDSLGDAKLVEEDASEADSKPTESL